MDAQTTIQQIGNVTLGSVGARKFSKTDDSLSFVISRGHRYVTITLNGDDTYTLTARMIRSQKATRDSAWRSSWASTWEWER